jgi:hypothetical protein
MAFDWAQVVAATIPTLPATAAFLVSFHNKGKIRNVQTSVDSGNSLTMGRLADNAESRRIEAVPEGERTREDWSHRRDVLPPDP